jgi:hypothetical protein
MADHIGARTTRRARAGSTDGPQMRRAYRSQRASPDVIGVSAAFDRLTPIDFIACDHPRSTGPRIC